MSPRRMISPAFRFSSVVPALVLVACACGLPADALAVFGDTPADTVATATVLGEIIVEGNSRTSTALILREMGLKIGQPFSYQDMDPVWDHLEDLGYFAFVDMEFDDDDPETVVLIVYVEEDSTLEYGPLIRYDRRHKYLLGGRLAERNLGGRGETLEASISVYYMQRGDVSWTRPWLFGASGLELRVAAEAEQANFVFRPTKYRKGDAGLQLKWNFAGPFFVLGAADYGSFNQRDTYSWDLPDRGADAPEGRATYESGFTEHWVLRGAIGLDSRDNRFYPSRGVYGEGSVRRWLSDDFESYTEGTLDGRLFVPVPIKEHVLALRGWGRQTDGPAQLDNVLFFGGPETVRGYRFGLQEGDEGYLLSAEYRVPLFIMPISPRGELIGAGLHAFYDAGDAWYHGAHSGRAMQSWGAGVHLNLDTLNLRFEAANTREGDWRFEFMDVFNF